MDMALLLTQAPPVKHSEVPASILAGGKLSLEQKAALYKKHDQDELLNLILSISKNKTDLFIKRKTYLRRSYEILRVAEHYLLKEYDQLYGD